MTFPLVTSAQSPGSTIGPYEFSFSATTTEPPTGSQLRLDNADPMLATKVWVRNLTTPGMDVHRVLLVIDEGATLYVQDFDDSTRFYAYDVIGPVVDRTDYLEFSVIWHSGGQPLLTQKVAFFALFPAGELPPTPTPPTGGNLLTIEEARTYCLRDPADASLDDLWNALIPGISEACGLWADRQFTPQDGVVRMFAADGWAGRVVLSPYEVRNVYSVQLDGTETDAYTFQPIGGTTQGTWWSIVLDGVGDVLTIDGDWGMETIPETAKLAARIALETFYENAAAHASESLGGHSYSDIVSTVEIGGLPRASRTLLDNFRRISVT